MYTLLHRGFMICSSYRTPHYKILNLKQIFRSNMYSKNIYTKYLLNASLFVHCPSTVQAKSR